MFSTGKRQVRIKRYVITGGRGGILELYEITAGFPIRLRNPSGASWVFLAGWAILVGWIGLTDLVGLSDWHIGWGNIQLSRIIRTPMG